MLLENKVHFLYRAIGQDGISRLGYAVSADGFHLHERLPYPVYEHKKNQKPYFNIFSQLSGGSWGGAEDPRLVRVENEDVLYMTYTAVEQGLRVALTSIKIKDFLSRQWNWKKPLLISPPGEVHKNWVIFPEKIKGRYAILHSLSPRVQISYLETLDLPEGFYIQSYFTGSSEIKSWHTRIKGAGVPPLKTKYGWLLFYHGMDKDWGKYKVGVMMLDLKNPEKVIHCFSQPVLQPEEDYENQGFKGGVIYLSGAVVKEEKLLLYYGAADSYVSCAFADFEKFVSAIIRDKKPKISYRLVKEKKK